MSQSTLQRQEAVEQVRCVRCGRRDATKEDHLCDSCRFEQALDNMFKNR